MRIYVICPVRNADPAITAMIADYVSKQETAGHQVHFPPRDVDQTDPTGIEITRRHLAAMKLCDEVHVFWNMKSSGSHADLGMAIALDKKIGHIHLFEPDGPGKSYVKVMRAMDGTPFCPTPESFAFNNPSASPTGDISLSHA